MADLRFLNVTMHQPMTGGRHDGKPYPVLGVLTAKGTLRRVRLSDRDLVTLVRDAARLLPMPPEGDG